MLFKGAINELNGTLPTCLAYKRFPFLNVIYAVKTMSVWSHFTMQSASFPKDFSQTNPKKYGNWQKQILKYI